MFAAVLCLALGSLPLSSALAQDAANDSVPTMSCHDQNGGSAGGDEAPNERMKECADHCLSRVNGPIALVRLSGPSFLNSVPSEPTQFLLPASPHDRDPPEPPPPRP
ncbi:MAG: hypothetical protein AB7J28_13510 [Hyphomonadaceae bacterium]